MIKVPSHKVSIGILYETLERLSHDGNKDIKSLSDYVNVSQAYLASSINTLKMVGCIDEFGNLKQQTKKILEIYSNKQNASDLFKEILIKWDPFILYLSYLSNNYNPTQSINKVNYFYMFDKKDLMLSIFNKWIKELNIDIKEKTNFIQNNSNYFISKYSNTIYLCDILGDEIYKFLDTDIKSELIDAINCFEDAEKSVSKTGKALEDFLRIIDKDRCSSLSTTNGITQIANELKGKNILHQKHNKICEALGDIRNMAGHGKEKITLQQWKLTSNSAVSYFHIVVSLITSIYNYVYHGLQTF